MSSDLAERVRQLEAKVGALERTVARLSAMWHLPERVELAATPSNQGWTLTFALPEPALDVEASIGGEPFARLQTGLAPGRPALSAWAVIPHARARYGEIALRWRAPEDGAPRGPFSVTFNPHGEVVAATKRFLEAIPHWVAFSTKYDGRLKVYFTYLLSYKDAISQIRVWVDDVEAAPVAFTSGAQAPGGRAAGIGEGDECYRLLPNETRSVSVELTFIDGSASDVRRVLVAEACDV